MRTGMASARSSRGCAASAMCCGIRCANVPVALGDSDRFFSEIGMTKLRESAANVSMTVTEEFTGAAPTVAFLDGVPVAVETTPAAAGSDLPGIATAKLPQTRLGFATPTLFLARRDAGNRQQREAVCAAERCGGHAVVHDGGFDSELADDGLVRREGEDGVERARSGGGGGQPV